MVLVHYLERLLQLFNFSLRSHLAGNESQNSRLEKTLRLELLEVLKSFLVDGLRLSVFLHPGVVQSLFGANPLTRVVLQHSANQAFCLFRNQAPIIS
jgi:hypothetical protein